MEGDSYRPAGSYCVTSDSPFLEPTIWACDDVDEDIRAHFPGNWILFYPEHRQFAGNAPYHVFPIGFSTVDRARAFLEQNPTYQDAAEEQLRSGSNEPNFRD
jgi:hypothetical protein